MLAIARSVGTPVYVYEADVIKQRIALLRSALHGLPVRLLYAMKANALPEIIRHMHVHDIGMECVSPAEVALALELGIPAADVLYTPNNITDREMHEVREMGVLFNIGEISRFEKYVRAFPDSPVSIRINPEFGSGHHDFVVTGGKRSKFGIPITQLIRVHDLAGRYGTKIVGLHQHIGSGVENLGVLRAAMEIILRISHDFPDLQFVNFGGGINVPYEDTDQPFDPASFRAAAAPLLQKYAVARNNRIRYRFEPGRFLVAEAGTLLTTVNTIKETADRVFAGVDSGFNHLIRPVLYGAHHGVFNLSNPEGTLSRYDLVGNVCESGDILAGDRKIQEIREGDVIAVLDAGAYGISMASEYNLRPLPAEVWIGEEGNVEVVRNRETTAQMVTRLLRS